MKRLSPEEEPVDVVISIVSHRNQGLVRACLRSLPDACPSLRWRAITTENLPREGPDLRLEFPKLHVVENAAPLGFGENHNNALMSVIDNGLARYVLVLNDDTELEPGCVTTLVERADAEPSIGSVGPLLRWPNGDHQHSYYSFPTVRRTMLAAFRPRLLLCTPRTDGVGWLGGACLLLRTTVLQEIGLFDTRFFLFFEDTDLAARLWASGWRVEMWPSAVTLHHEHQTVSHPDVRAAMECQMLRSAYLYFTKYSGRLSAAGVTLAGRSGSLLRGTAILVVATLTKDRHRKAQARRLLAVAGYDGHSPLPHEPSAHSTDAQAGSDSTIRR